MKFKLNNKYVRWGLTAFLVIVASICFYYLIFHGADIRAGVNVLIEILMPVVFAVVLAYLLTPVLNYLEQHLLIPMANRLKLKDTPKRNSVIRGVAIILTVFLFFTLVYVLCAMMLSQIVPSIQNIVSNFDSYLDNFTNWLYRLLEDNPNLGTYATNMVNKYSVELETWLNETVFTKTSQFIMSFSLSIISVLGVLWDFIIGFVISIYLMASKEKFAGQAKKIAYAMFERDTANTVVSNFRFTHKTFISFISGKILDSIIIGLLCFIGTTLMNTPYAVLISVVIGVTNVIPFFGPFIGAIPCTVLIFVMDPMHPLNCLYFVIFIFILQQFDGNVLGPKILGDSTGLTGFWVIFAITLFGGLMGVVGMIIGVPLFAVIYAAIKSLVNAALKKKDMPDDIDLYVNLGSVDDEGFHEYIPNYKQKEEKATEKKRSIIKRKETGNERSGK